jgi:hypothetical protein
VQAEVGLKNEFVGGTYASYLKLKYDETLFVPKLLQFNYTMSGDARRATSYLGLD